VTFQVSRDQKGLTWDNYQTGLAMWRRNKGIRSPWLGTNPNVYPKKKFIGYAGMDLGTIQHLEAGGRRQDRKEPARWGYGMYVTDNAKM
jgi:magnesium-dependent phosphatase 1